MLKLGTKITLIQTKIQAKKLESYDQRVPRYRDPKNFTFSAMTPLELVEVLDDELLPTTVGPKFTRRDEVSPFAYG